MSTEKQGDAEKLELLGKIVVVTRNSLCEILGSDGTIVVVYARTEVGDSVHVGVSEAALEGGPPLSDLQDAIRAAVKGFVDRCPQLREQKLKVEFKVNF